MLLPVPGLLRELGRDPSAVLPGAGMDLADFVDPDRRISFEIAGRLLAHCADATGLPHFGLLVGSRFRMTDLGILEPILRTAPSPRSALLGLIRNVALNDRGGMPYLHEPQPGLAAFGYTVYAPPAKGLAQVYDVALAIGQVMLRGLCGPGWKPVRVSFSHRAPPDLAPFRRWFRAPLVFDAPRSEIHFAGTWLNRPLAGHGHGDDAARMRLMGVVEHSDLDPLTVRVRRAAQVLAVTGTVTTERIGSLFGMPGHTLRRRLRDEGASLRGLINELRLDLARQLLTETRMPVSHIAQALGYGDTSAFSRAFRAGTGRAPSGLRPRKHRSGG
jgi:AraC-like DNA-binding protein